MGDRAPFLPHDPIMNERHPKRRSGPLGDVLNRLATPAMRKRGFVHGEIVRYWTSVVGDDLADSCIPLRIAFATGTDRGGVLHVAVDGAFATELQHLEPLVIERINAYFGYDAVARIRMTQSRVDRPRRPAPPTEPELDAGSLARLEALVSATRLSGLRDALRSLGRRVLGR
jgi:hypothetical protein